MGDFFLKLKGGIKGVVFRIVPIIKMSELSKSIGNPYSEFDDKYGIVFLHIPKTAGSALLKHAFDSEHNGHYRPVHYYDYSASKFLSYKKIAVVRNPWDRIVSAFHYLKQDVGGGKYALKFAQEWLGDIDKFEDFILRMQSDVKFRFAMLKWDHFRPQWDFISYNGVYCVDLLGRYEDIDGFYSVLCAELGMEWRELKKTNSSKRAVSYRDYFDVNARNFVAEIYSEEIEFLKYEF